MYIFKEDGAGFGVLTAIDRDYYGVADGALFFQSGFKVFGMDVEAGGGDDNIFFAAAKFEVAVRIEFA